MEQTPEQRRQAMKAAVAEAVAEHGGSHDGLIPVLSALNERLGSLPGEALVEVGQKLHQPASRVYAVATFYSMLSLEPRGRHVVQFCESAPCHVEGGRQVWQALRDELELAPGETSSDGRFTLLTTSCLGLCAEGPVVVVDDQVHANVTPEQVPALLKQYE
jgi:NADH:ubiquinone oxidoreductase subunit E